jgi:hypothetical protein
MNAQLGTDLAQGPALGVQGGCTLNIHRATVTNPHQIDLVRCPAYLPQGCVAFAITRQSESSEDLMLVASPLTRCQRMIAGTQSSDEAV